jgi:hypothetical protein
MTVSGKKMLGETLRVTSCQDYKSFASCATPPPRISPLPRPQKRQSAADRNLIQTSFTMRRAPSRSADTPLPPLRPRESKRELEAHSTSKDQPSFRFTADSVDLRSATHSSRQILDLLIQTLSRRRSLDPEGDYGKIVSPLSALSLVSWSTGSRLQLHFHVRYD